MKANLHRLIKTTVVAAAFVAGGASGIARADDSSMSPFVGDSYVYFNGGYTRSQMINPSFDKTPSAWRQNHPQGLPESVLQAYSASDEGEAWELNRPVFTGAASDPSFKQTHPNGLTEPELQALSSEAFGQRFGADSQAGGATGQN